MIRQVTTPGGPALLSIAPTRRAARARLRNKRVGPVAFPFQLTNAAPVGISIHERRGPRVARFAVSGRAFRTTELTVK